MSELTTDTPYDWMQEAPDMGEVVPFRQRVDLTKGTGTDGAAPAQEWLDEEAWDGIYAAPAPARPFEVPPRPDYAPTVPAQAPAPAQTEPEWDAELPEDIEGDTPLTPAWVKSWRGISNRRRYAQRQAKRAARRFAKRQITQHGMVPRSYRGVIRAHQWVRGTEGIAHQAHAERARQHALEARSAARKARYALLDRKSAARASAHANEQLQSTLKDVAAAKSAARRAMASRAALVYGPAAAALGGGAYVDGWWGMAGGAVLTLAAAIIPGRRTWLDEQEAFEERAEARVLDPGMTPRAFASMLRDALEEDLGVAVADLHVSGTAWGFQAEVQLFKAKPADVMARLDDLEASLVARPNSLLLQQSSKARPNFTLRALGSDPFAGMATLPYRAPLSQKVAEPIVLGRCLTQEPLTLPLLRTNGVMVGGPGSGKSTALLDVAEALTACEDVVVWDIDLGSSGAGLDPIAAALSRRATTKAAAEVLLKDALAIAMARPRLFKKLGMGRNWQPSPQHPALVVLIDEYPALVAAGLWPIVAEGIRTGRKSAVTFLMAAQGASKDFMGSADPASVPLRIALPCQAQDVTRLFGAGALAEGWAPHRLQPAEGNDPRDASVAYIKSGRHAEPIPYRFCWLDEDEAERRGEERRAAGLPQLDAESLTTAGVDLTAQLPVGFESWRPAADTVGEDGEYVAEDQEDVELPPIPAAAYQVLADLDGPALTPAELLAGLKAAAPVFETLSPKALGMAMTAFKAGARPFGRDRGYYFSDLVGAIASYRTADPAERAKRARTA
ncbi:hypothetical protein [Kitasatospora acidiphila]|uniref:hypothetical protein n=1 Tax=Kitasatospora acidiphila TaxID=2567942 RepID=UPI003C71F0B6